MVASEQEHARSESLKGAAEVVTPSVRMIGDAFIRILGREMAAALAQMGLAAMAVAERHVKAVERIASALEQIAVVVVTRDKEKHR